MLKLIIAKKNWFWAYLVSKELAKKLLALELLLKLLFLNQPKQISETTSSVK